MSKSARRFLLGTDEAAPNKILLSAGRLVAPVRGALLCLPYAVAAV